MRPLSSSCYRVAWSSLPFQAQPSRLPTGSESSSDSPRKWSFALCRQRCCYRQQARNAHRWGLNSKESGLTQLENMSRQQKMHWGILAISVHVTLNMLWSSFVYFMRINNSQRGLVWLSRKDLTLGILEWLGKEFVGHWILSSRTDRILGFRQGSCNYQASYKSLKLLMFYLVVRWPTLLLILWRLSAMKDIKAF